MNYDEILEQITLADLENVPNHEIEDTSFNLYDESQGSSLPKLGDIVSNEELAEDIHFHLS